MWSEKAWGINLIGFFINSMALTACASAPLAPAQKNTASGLQAPAEGDQKAENWDVKPYEDPWFSLLSVPPAPIAPPEPPSEPPPIEHPPTYGTCVGKPSEAAKDKRGSNMCCYTPPSYFQKHVRMKWPELKACYEKALERNSKTRGRVTSKFTIEQDGTVTQACDSGSTVGDPKLVECVLNVMTTVTFEAYSIGNPCPAVTLMYPIQFSPETSKE